MFLFRGKPEATNFRIDAELQPPGKNIRILAQTAYESTIDGLPHFASFNKHTRMILVRHLLTYVTSYE
jgi:hypothetical protein